MRDADDRPNIILFNCDDLGYGDVGCYGSRVNDTPHLDRMASEGMLFTDFYMASSICSPSRGAMLTGCYPTRIGFSDFDGAGVLFPGQPIGLDPAEITFARVLKDRGYATLHVGKWHCGDQPDFLPTRHGFDRYFGIPYSNDMGRQRSHEDRPPLPLLDGESVIQQQPDQASLTERYVEHSTRFLREHRDEPILLYFADLHVHLPHYAPAHMLRASRNGRYGACVACIDWAVGALLAELRRLGLDRNTLVLFTSDNGSRGDRGGSNAPLRGKKGTTWEGGQRLPLIAWWPGRIPAGATCGEIATSMDFLPSFARLAGTRPPADRVLDGRDITPLWFAESGARSPHAAFFYYAGSRLAAVRSGRWKLHLGRPAASDRPGSPADIARALYDLQTDTAETTDVAARHPEAVRELEGLAGTCRRDLGDSGLGMEGAGCRPIGRLPEGRPLTEYDPSHPYIQALYDLPDSG